MFTVKFAPYIDLKVDNLCQIVIVTAVMADTCVQLVDGKRGGRNSSVLLNVFRFRYSNHKVNNGFFNMVMIC